MAAKVYVSELPECNFCPRPRDDSPAVAYIARFDFRTRHRAWANGCYRHWLENRAVAELGTGNGQLLLTPGEIAGEVIVNLATREFPAGLMRQLAYAEFGDLVFERKERK